MNRHAGAGAVRGGRFINGGPSARLCAMSATSAFQIGPAVVHKPPHRSESYLANAGYEAANKNAQW